LLSWIVLYPELYKRERESIENAYREELSLDQDELVKKGNLVYSGTITTRTQNGIKHYRIILSYPQDYPSSPPIVKAEEFYSYRHQMPDGVLCLFEREPNGNLVGISGIDVLRRAKQWFSAHDTSHWPSDSIETELEAHFKCSGYILISESAYDKMISKGGTFYAAKVKRYPDHHLYFLTAIRSDLSDVITVKNTKEEFFTVFPFIDESLYNPEELTKPTPTDEIVQAFEEGKLVKGIWFEVKEEPVQWKKLGDLIMTLAKEYEWSLPTDNFKQVVSDLIGGRSLYQDCIYIAILYPERDNNRDWLFLEANLEKISPIINEEKSTSRINNATLKTLIKESISHDNIFLRNRYSLPSNVRNFKVALLGCGAIGSELSQLLAKVGISGLTLCDHDILHSGNVIRHYLGLHWTGSPKVVGLLFTLPEHNPKLNISLADSPVKEPTALMELLKKNDISISSIADVGTELLINHVANITMSSVIYVYLLHQGFAGICFLVRPGKDACFRCRLLYEEDFHNKKEVPNDFIFIPNSPHPVIIRECGDIVVPGNAASATLIASLATQFLLDFISNPDMLENQRIWVDKKILDTIPMEQLHKSIQYLPVIISGSLKPHPKCHICRKPELSKVIMSNRVKDRLVSLALCDFEKEMGGAIVGWIAVEGVAYIEDILEPGPKSARSKTHCSRDPEYTNIKLKEYHDSSNGKAVYLGEWHSHIDGIVSPSHTDVMSMFNITSDQDYLITTPLAIIISIDSKKKSVKNIRCYCFPLSGSFFAVNIKVVD